MQSLTLLSYFAIYLQMVGTNHIQPTVGHLYFH